MASFLRRSSDPHAVPSVFPTFLLPSVPFRRKSRQSSSDSTFSSTSYTSTSTATTTTTNPFPTSPRPSFPSSSADDNHPTPPTDKFLHAHTSHIHCAKCSTDLCLTAQIISKGFTGRHGRAYLVQGTPSHIMSTPTPTSRIPGQLPNTYQTKPVPRNLVTGQHTVSDISCAICGSVLGWKYVEASEESQKYKVGKFILETKRIRVGVCWENDENSDQGGEPETPEVADDVEFDSQDEDECEDLFAGVWSAQLAAKRRAKKGSRFGVGSSRGREGKIEPRAGALRARSEDILG